MDIYEKIELNKQLVYKIECSVSKAWARRKPTDKIIDDIVKAIAERDQVLQLQQTGVSGCFSKEEVVNIILEFTNIALHSNSHNLTRTELIELLRVAKNSWLNNR